MEKQELAVGRYVEFFHKNGFQRLGRIKKIEGKNLTVVLAPFGFKGKNEGQRVRLHVSQITGIVYRKKVVACSCTT